MNVHIVEGKAEEHLYSLDRPASLILTSPPYGSLREYGGEGFDYAPVADAIVTALAPGGVLIWVVADETVGGSESGESMRQALGFMERGLLLHDTMIYRRRGNGGRTYNSRHCSGFEFMFVLSKGKPAVVNIIEDVKANPRHMEERTRRKSLRNRAGVVEVRGPKAATPALVRRDNVWDYSAGRSHSAPDFPQAHEHPAIFPYALAADHVRTWTNVGDLVVDPMAGSGTTLRAAVDLGRAAVGIEAHPPYVDLIRRRMAQEVMPWYE